jgi:hypothetical protein
VPRRARRAPGEIVYHTVNRAYGVNELFQNPNDYSEFLAEGVNPWFQTKPFLMAEGYSPDRFIASEPSACFSRRVVNIEIYGQRHSARRPASLRDMAAQSVRFELGPDRRSTFLNFFAVAKDLGRDRG